ncbi:MAG TPA: hypothetical protein VLE51_00395 [Candidatus Saccharimonadales bacterium]|nr:hypothetical protein [Candidatus Saccharimonadales bacterium]
MIDAIYARYSRLKEKPLDPAYRPEKAIKNTLRLNADSDKLAVIFPGWHTHKFPVVNLANRLSKQGWGVIAYDFHDQILLPDDDIVVESFRHIRDTITKELNDLLSDNKYSQVHLIGISLGNVPLAMVADRFPHFQGATLVVGGDDLAIDMWYGLRTVNIQRAFQKMHIGIRKLDSEWHDLAPASHVRHFSGKKVVFVMSLRDKFIRTKYQQKLAEKIAKVGADIDVRPTRFGHTMTIVRFCLLDPLP